MAISGSMWRFARWSYRPDSQVSWVIGSGIVADSQPDAEWQECLLKARFLSDCDPGLKLIETLRRENGVNTRAWPGIWRACSVRLHGLVLRLDEASASAAACGATAGGQLAGSANPCEVRGD
jgi:hypothetical protein